MHLGKKKAYLTILQPLSRLMVRRDFSKTTGRGKKIENKTQGAKICRLVFFYKESIFRNCCDFAFFSKIIDFAKMYRISYILFKHFRIFAIFHNLEVSRFCDFVKKTCCFAKCIGFSIYFSSISQFLQF